MLNILKDISYPLIVYDESHTFEYSNKIARNLFNINNNNEPLDITSYTYDKYSIIELINFIGINSSKTISYKINTKILEIRTLLIKSEHHYLFLLDKDSSDMPVMNLIFDEMIENITDPVFMFDLDNNFQYVNTSFATFHNIGKEQIIGKHISTLYNPELSEKFIQDHKRTIETCEVVYNESEVTNDRGELIIASTALNPVKKSNGKIVGVIGIARDITQRRLLELEKEKQERSLRLINDIIMHAGDSIFFTDLDGKYQYVNRAFARIHGLKPKDVIGKTTNDLFAPELAKELSEANKKIIETGTEFIKDFDVIIQGERVIGNTVKRPYYDIDGNLRGITGITRDVTQERLIEARLAENSKIESLGTLAGGFAHDFNNLLSGILGYTDLLLLDETDQYKISQLKEIDKIANQAKKITKKLLELGKQGNNDKTAINLNKTIFDVISVVKHTKSENIEFVFDLDDNLPSIDGDAGQIFQVFLNILINAIEAIEGKGWVQISTLNHNIQKRNEFNLPPGSYVKAIIHDSGTGIPKHLLTKIFDPFFSTKSDKISGGYGLGLSTANSIIVNHNGIIDVKSNQENGTMFQIIVPVGKLEQQIVNVEKIDTVRSIGKILIIDDNIELLNVMNQYLMKFGYDVLIAEDGSIGMELFEQHHDISLVILDFTMPKMDGMDTYKSIKKYERDTKIMLMTGFSKIEKIMELEKMGIDDIIHKPFHLSALLLKINTLL